MRRTIEIGWLPGLGVLAVAVLAAALLLILATPSPRPFAPGGIVNVTFTVSAAVSAQASGDTVLIRTNVPWTATLVSATGSGTPTLQVFRGAPTGSRGRPLRARGRLVSFTVVPQP